MQVHLLARECACLCVTRRAHKEGRIVSKQRIRKDNGKLVGRQGKIKNVVCESKKHLNVMKEVMGCRERGQEAKELIDCIYTSTLNLH